MTIYNWLLVDSYHSDARMRRMFLQILVERHGFLDDLLVYHRRIKQVQAVFLPDCKAQVSNVQPFLIAGNGDDVSIVDSLTQSLRTAT